MDVRSVESIVSDDEDVPLYKTESLWDIKLYVYINSTLWSATLQSYCQPLNALIVAKDSSTGLYDSSGVATWIFINCGRDTTYSFCRIASSTRGEKKVDRQNAEAIDRVILKLKECATGNSSFTFIIDDPAGTSFVENPFAPSPDPSSHIEFYERTVEHQDMFGYAPDPTPSIAASSSQGTVEPHGSVGAVAGHRAIAQGNNTLEFSEALFRYSAPEEVMSFPSMCSACAVTCETRMYVTNIPYVREVIVMASTCDGCGYRSSELKTGGAIPKKGRRVSVSVQNVHDLSRDIIKSDTAGVIIPEIALELTSGTLGGLVTTVEGLVTMISEALERLYGFTVSDSLEDKNIKWRYFRARLTKLSSLEEPWTLILDDALANSCIASVCDDIKDDHQLSIEEYDRSLEQNEELGLVDMDTSAVDAAYNSVEAS